MESDVAVLLFAPLGQLNFHEFHDRLPQKDFSGKALFSRRPWQRL